VGDLTQPGTLPNASYDCIVLPQVLQYLFDLRAGIVNLHRALKPGGVLLLTAPALSQCDQEEPWTWYWRFTTPAVRRLLEDQFGKEAVSVEAHGNVFAATAFLYGIATEEVSISDLSVDDANYPIVVAARVIRRKDE
jgi:SAM-dependent methyltransferase